MTRYVTALLVVLAACGDSTSTSGPNFVARNSGPEAARFVIVNPAGDTLFNLTVAPNVQECRTLVGENISGAVYLAADTFQVRPFYAPRGFAKMLIVTDGPDLIQTQTTRTSC